MSIVILYPSFSIVCFQYIYNRHALTSPRDTIGELSPLLEIPNQLEPDETSAEKMRMILKMFKNHQY